VDDLAAFLLARFDANGDARLMKCEVQHLQQELLAMATDPMFVFLPDAAYQVGDRCAVADVVRCIVVSWCAVAVFYGL
jgi:hypothetical protein